MFIGKVLHWFFFLVDCISPGKLCTGKWLRPANSNNPLTAKPQPANSKGSHTSRWRTVPPSGSHGNNKQGRKTSKTPLRLLWPPHSSWPMQKCFPFPLTGHKKCLIFLSGLLYNEIPFNFQFWTNTDFPLYMILEKSLDLYGRFGQFIKGEPSEEPR